MERDPRKVLEDVIAEKVTVKRARETYGVVIDIEARQIDARATQELRRERKQLQRSGGREHH